MADHRTIIQQLGGIRAVARLLKHEHHTTVQGWSERNSIPVDHWPALLEASAQTDRPLKALELVPADAKAAEPRSPKKAA